MGEAQYYLKAYFADAQSATKAEKKVRPILNDIVKFYNDWQGIRGGKGSPASRYNLLFSKHKYAKKYLYTSPVGEDSSLNNLAGRGDLTTEYNLKVVGNELRLDDYVWHFADWDYYKQIFLDLGATSVNWLNEENADPYESL